jgi:SAM-dependent methyltransferase
VEFRNPKSAMSQHWDPERYARNARFVADLGVDVLQLLDPQPGERILDLGCGDGALTEKIAAIGCIVVGVDASPDQIAAAKRRGIDACVVSGEKLAFDNEFDAVFSNAALHWMKRADDVIAGVHRALKPGGRFVAECGGAGNVAKIERALTAALARRGIDARPLNPWSFPTTQEYSAKLISHGFRVESIALVPRPTPLPTDLDGWLATFAESFTSALEPENRPAFIAEVREALRPELCDETGLWIADYVRLRFAATKA